MRFATDKYHYALRLLMDAGLPYAEASAIAMDVARHELAKGYRA